MIHLFLEWLRIFNTTYIPIVCVYRSGLWETCSHKQACRTWRHCKSRVIQLFELEFCAIKNQSSVIIFSHLCADSSIYFCIFVEKKELENHPICEEICYLSQLSLNFLVLWKYTKNALCRFQMTTNKFVIRSLRDII